VFVLAFFDYAGGELTEVDSLIAAVSAVNAFLFLADPLQVPGLGQNGSHLSTGDPTLNSVCDLLSATRGDGGMISLAAAIVISKSDLLEDSRPEVARWLSREDDHDLSTIEQESEDVSAFLEANGGGAWLKPTRTFPNSTLHFLSATQHRRRPRHRLLS
jgi:hypothetical protein